jgi:hypothetical protein
MMGVVNTPMVIIHKAIFGINKKNLLLWAKVKIILNRKMKLVIQSTI